MPDPLPPTPVRLRILLTAADGRVLPWRKQGRINTLPEALAATWVANFKPGLFQMLGDGAIVPRGSEPGAVDIVAVASAPDA
jgi:hypothetical protein